jgi:hypothetical protein
MPFSTYERTDSSRKRGNESSFEFLDRSARTEIERVREYFGAVVSYFPEAERAEIVARLRSGNEVAFRSASFEVLLYWGLSRSGYQLQPHPDPGTGSTKRPDFLVCSPDGEQFFLEAVLAGEDAGRNPAAEAMKRTTLDRLDEAAHPSFLLDIDSDGDPSSQPSSNELIARAHAWLNSLDVDALRTQFEAVGLEAMPTLEWSHDLWQLTLRAIPMRRERRGQTNRLIGALGDGVRWTNTWEPLRGAVKKKANRYGALDKPLVIAINVDSFHLDAIDEVQALYGEESWVEVLGHPERSGPQRQPNGAWRGPKGPQNRRASAVWFFNDLTPYTLGTRRSTLYLNPWAHLPTPSCMLTFPHKRLTDDELVSLEGKSLSELFGVPDDWPE